MTKKIIIAVLIILAEMGLGYYSLMINGSYFWKFMFYILSAFIICLLVINGVGYILPKEEHFHHSDEIE